MAGVIGCGSSVTPSKPDSPNCTQSSSALVQSSITVYISCMYRLPNDGFCSTRVDFYISLPNRLEYASSIEGGLLERGIAVDGADTQQFDVWVVGGD